MRWKVVRRQRNASATLGCAGIGGRCGTSVRGRASITFEKAFEVMKKIRCG
jgi:hypothetical protein